MKVPIEWLKELVNFRAGADQLAEMLTTAGLETISLADEILDVDVLPNRADAFSVRGIAREISALTKFKLKPVRHKVNETGRKISGQVKVEVRDKELCPRYMARVITNIKVGESPEWLKKRLERAGMRPINNVVDVTNYLLHEIGQPMHAFDAALIKDQFIIVRRANPEEKVVTLDGKTHLLSPEVLVIADPDKAVAIAGVMGAANTEVSEATKTIILESAFFNPVSIHKTSKALKVRSESSVRFEHGVDWNAVEEALDRGAAMLAELGRGDVLKGKIDLLAKERKPKVIELRIERINQILGAEISIGDITSILSRLGFITRKIENRKLKIGIPLFRAMDIEREIDLIEEIARIWGYNRIEATLPDTAFTGKTEDREDLFRTRVREVMIGCGLNEVQTYSMLGPQDFKNTGILPDKSVVISNPLTVEESIMRTHLLPGLLKVMQYNQNRQMENVFIFEIGKVFEKKGEGLPEERWTLGGAVMGLPFMSALDKGEADFFYTKGILENLFGALGIDLPDLEMSENFLLQPGKAAAVGRLGYFGALHPEIQRNYALAKPVFCFEINLDALQKIAPANQRYRPIPKYPFISRDVSMFIPADLSNQIIIETIKAAGGELVKAAFPFDKYKDSAAYRIIYQDPGRTLTEAEVNEKHALVVKELVDKLKVGIR